MLCVNKTWQCHFSQVGRPRTVCFHSTSFQLLGTTTCARWEWQLSCYQMRLHFYCFSEISALSRPWGLGFILLLLFPAFLSLCSSSPHQGRQAALCPVFCHWIIWKAGGATMGKQTASCRSPRLSGGCWWAQVFQLHGKSCESPCSLDNQKKLFQRRLAHPTNRGACRSPSFRFPNSLLAAKSTRTDIILC